MVASAKSPVLRFSPCRAGPWHIQPLRGINEAQDQADLDCSSLRTDTALAITAATGRPAI